MSALDIMTHARNRGTGLVSLCRSEYDIILKKPAGYEVDFHDEDGICTTFFDRGFLMIKTQTGASKTLISVEEFQAVLLSGGTAVPSNPFGAFMSYCAKAGIPSELYMGMMQYIKDKNDDLYNRLSFDKTTTDGETHYVLVAVITMSDMQSFIEKCCRCTEQLVDVIMSLCINEADLAGSIAEARAGSSETVLARLQKRGCANSMLKIAREA
jgi:hypothetical protein